MNRLPFHVIVLLSLLVAGCTTNTSVWNQYRPVYFNSQEEAKIFSTFLQTKDIASVTLGDVQLSIANFPKSESKTWQELERMIDADPRKDDFVKGLPALFQSGNSWVVYIPQNVSPSTLQKYARQQKIELWFGPDEIDTFKKMTYLVCFSLVGIFWIFLRKPQAFFSLFALVLGLIFIQVSPEIYYALVVLSFAYSILLDNWNRHYTLVRSQATPTLKAIRRTVLSWLIFLGAYGISVAVLKVNFAGSFLVSLYFALLLASSFLWIFWVKNRSETLNYVSFFPSHIVGKNLSLYTSHGFFYLGALIIGLLPSVILSLSPSPPQAKEYIDAQEALYSDLDRTSLLILYRTPGEYPNLANYLAHRFYQQSLPLLYTQSFSFPTTEETITQKVYDFNGIQFIEEKEQILLSLSDEWIIREIADLPPFWRILISPQKKLLAFKTANEPSLLFMPFESYLIWISFGFFLIFSLKIRSYFRIISPQ